MGYQLVGLLAQALLVLGSPTYTAREDQFFHHSREPVQITEKEFTMFQRYANYSSASYSTCGATPFGSTLVDYLNIHSTSTQAALFRDDVEQEFVMAMPGTSSAEDERLDFMDDKVPFVSPGLDPKSCGHCHVHQGFLKAWDSLANPSAEAITKAMADYPHYRFSLTGHSLGAAIASLATAGLHAKGFKIRRTVTFGEPRVGGPRYANHIDNIMGANKKEAGRYHRVTHANDGVPQAPSRAQGYRHSRTEYFEKGLGDKESWKRTFRCFGQEPSNCNDATNPSSLTDKAHGLYAGIVMGALAADCTD